MVRKKIKIVLVSPEQTSTRILLENIETASNLREVEVEVIAISAEIARSNARDYDPDILLIGPQASYLDSQLKVRYGSEFLVETVNRHDYGSMNGESVLDFAISLLENV